MKSTHCTNAIKKHTRQDQKYIHVIVQIQTLNCLAIEVAE